MLRGEVLGSTLVLPFTNFVTYLAVEIEEKNISQPCGEDSVGFVESTEHEAKCSIFSVAPGNMKPLKHHYIYMQSCFMFSQGQICWPVIFRVNIAANL